METFRNFNEWLSNSVLVKLSSIGFMILILLIPDAMIQSLINERQSVSNDTRMQISEQWGKDQILTGPVLMITFTKRETVDGKVTLSRENAYLLPEKLAISGGVNPEKRHRSIYSIVVYHAVLQIKGHFSMPDWNALGIDSGSVIRNEVRLILGVPDMRGITNNVILHWGDLDFAADPGLQNQDIAGSGMSIPVNWSLLEKGNGVDFNLPLEINGSDMLGFVPAGKETDVDLHSPWKDPSFTGAFLPGERSITDTGFHARWKVLHLNRNFPQQWIGNAFKTSDSQFGVRFIVAVDHYQKAMRSAKYALMFLTLTFAVFFFVEVINKMKIHPMQYLFVGLALILFYSLLLSLSEQMPFNLAYLISTLAIITMIVLYSRTIFREPKLVWILGAFLVILYGFLFILLQMEAYALLLGTVGLFLVLGSVMVLSRNINWFQPLTHKGKPE